MVEYGIGLNLTNWVGDLYINAIILACMSILANISSGQLTQIFGRKKMIYIYYVCAAVPTLVYSFVSEFSQYTIILIYFAKFSVSSNYNLVGLQVCELFDAAVRNTAYGLIEFVSLLATSLIPFLVSKSIWTTIGMSLVSIFGCMSVVPLPETNNMSI